MDNRILVTYATKAGSTGDIAARVAEVLGKNGHAVEVLPVGEATDITPFRAVVLGSAIHAGRLLPGAQKFIERNRAALNEKPFAVFIVCLAMKECSDKNLAMARAYLDPVRARVTPVSEGMFAGVMNAGKLGFVERTIMKAMKSPDGDYRNWAEVETWSSALATALKPR
jgi:menaquinone-dependent protoporphyrinogen oxidase